MGIYGEYIIENNNKISNNMLSNFTIEMIHLIKFIYQPDKRSSSWISSIFNAFELNIKIFTLSSFNMISDDNLDKSYKRAINKVLKETGLDNKDIQNKRSIEFNKYNLISLGYIYNLMLSNNPNDKIRLDIDYHYNKIINDYKLMNSYKNIKKSLGI